MRLTISLCLAATVVLATSALHGQNAGLKPQTSANCPAATDLTGLIKALDDAISGPGDKDRTCLRELLLPGARLTPVVHAQDGSYNIRALSVDDWINAVARRGSTPFYEHQVRTITESYGHFAHLWSTYEIRDTPDGKATVTGINSVQAINDGTRWRVLSVLWEPDNTAGPIPEKYKP